jgi:NAD(P)-dependent dehydrogenase (short-subunit alcohol dehydrogenase family)
MDNFEGRVAVVTGAASGIGREFARRAAQLRMKVVVSDVQPEALETVRAEIAATGVPVLALRVDVSNAAEVDELARRTVDAFGRVNLVFNNAGVITGGLVWEHSDADWRWLLGVNLLGVINGVRAFTPLLMREGEEAHLVNTASVAGLISPSRLGAYAVSKHSVVALTECLYHDLQSVGAALGVSVLCPAFVPTGLVDSERNRPVTIAQPERTESQRAAADATKKAVAAGKVTAEEVARLTFEAVRERRFYVLTHPRILDSVKNRHEDIQLMRNPADSFHRSLQSTGIAQAD